MRIGSWLAVGAASFFIGVYEVSLVPALPFPLDALRPALPIIVILIVLERQSAAYIFAAIVGIIFDLMSASHYSAYTIGLLLTVLLLDILAEKTMTNRSLYSTLIMMLAADFLIYSYRLLSAAVFTWVKGGTFIFDGVSLVITVFILSFVQVAVWFLLVSFFTRRFMVRLSIPEQKYG